MDLLAAPPLGLCCVAGAAESAGFEVSVLDLCFAPGNLREYLAHAIGKFQPQVIGLSVRNVDNVNMLHSVSYLPEIVKIAQYVRDLSSAPLVIGGSGASLLPESMLRLLKADYVIVSDGEEPFVRLLNAIESGKSSENIAGVGALVGDEFHLSKPKLTNFESGRVDIGKWIDTKPYWKIGSAYSVQTKRGCRQNCIYCTYNQSLEGNKLRLRNPVDVVDGIEEAIGKYGITTFEIVDSVFNDPLDHSGTILEELCRRSWKADFTTMGVQPRNLDKSYLDLMWRAGFRSFMITPESASDMMLRSYRKGFTRDEVVHAAEAINRTAFAAWWFFMIGGPGETNQTLQESLDFSLNYLPRRKRAVTNIAHFFFGVRIYPGTQLWNMAMEERFIQSEQDALQPLWYLSKALDLDRAVDQMNAAASRCPEIYLGFDERTLMFSQIAATLFSFMGLPKPFWRYFRAANHFGIKSGIRFMFRPADIPGMLRRTLKDQS